MAAPIGHIYLALRLLAGPLQNFDQQDFLIGASFPDIRYWAHMPREHTHIPNVQFSDILKETDSFTAGMLFHSFVDDIREQYFKQRTTYLSSLIYMGNYNGYLLKTVEDIILFEKIPDKSFISYFDNILKAEEKLISNSILLKKWHATLQHYFAQGPTPFSIHALLDQQALPTVSHKIGIKLLYQLSKKLAASPKLKKTILSFYENFESIINAVPQQAPSVAVTQ
jgi:hypothetical protein